MSLRIIIKVQGLKQGGKSTIIQKIYNALKNDFEFYGEVPEKNKNHNQKLKDLKEKKIKIEIQEETISCIVTYLGVASDGGK